MVRFSAETIHIENLRVSGVIGVRPEERIRRQPLIVNVAVEQDFARAADSDDVSHTLDYAELCGAIRAFVEAQSFQLLETLIRRLALHLHGRFPIARLSLHIRKPEAIAEADAVAVSLTLAREPQR
jgi:dihydroneopterin aldolase